MRKTKKKLKLTKGERFIYIFTIILLLSFPFLSVFSKSHLSQVNYEVEEVKEEISGQAKTNESLQMKINELASLENLETVAKEMGLSYTYNSVKTVE